jgi:putative membrane protein
MSPAVISEFDRTRITEAIRTAESSTAGEIYVVVARQADEYRFIPIMWGAIAALVIVWPLFFLTHWTATTILVLQAVTFVGITALASHPMVRHRLVPASIAAEASRKAAMAQFLAHGVHLTENKTGVLIYVAWADRRVEIVADAGIDRRVDQSVWDQLASHVAREAKAGQLVKGLIAAVRGAGSVLSDHFPPGSVDQNELPDRVVEI